MKIKKERKKNLSMRFGEFRLNENKTRKKAIMKSDERN